MKIPLSWLREFVTFPSSKNQKEIVADVCDAFTRIGFEVEGIANPATMIKGPLLIGTVISYEEITGLKKRIRYVEVDCAEKNHRFVICGATNFEVGDKIVMALPGAVLVGDFVISARETYGKTSNGMICSSRELGLSDEHAGIIVVTDPSAHNGSDALPVLGADDPVIDIAINPDRGYALSIRGASREIATALSLPFKDPFDQGYPARLEKIITAGVAVKVAIADKTGADLIYLRSLTKVNAKAESPEWMKRRLSQCGMRSISLAVDITNYVMLELGQPLHAFDAGLISGTLRVTRADKFTEITTLDKEKRKLDKSNLLIADDKHPLAIAGTMGGLDCEVTDATTTIAVEAAHFDAVAIAKNARSHNLSSEASRRFERGVDPALAEIASARAALLLCEYAGASYVGTHFLGAISAMQSISILPQDISALVGYHYSDDQIAKALTALGCLITRSTTRWKITPPTYRPDLLSTADLAEEVARSYGYDIIPSIMPEVKTSSTGASGLTPQQYRKRAIALKLAHRGLTQVHNYPFVSEAEMRLFGFTGDRAKTFRIANPMSDEFPFLRTHLTPGLFATAARNIARGAKDVAIFELGAVFRNLLPVVTADSVSVEKRPTEKELAKIYAGVPEQPVHVAGVLIGNIERSGWWGKGRAASWSDAIDLASEIIAETGNEPTLHAADLTPWHPGRCAEFRIDGVAVAHAGEIHPRISVALGLPPRSAAFVVLLDALPVRGDFLAPRVWTMPAAIQDISIFVSKTVTSSQVAAALRSGAGDLLESITLFDRYEKEGEDQVSLAFSLVFRAQDRTLTADEVSGYRASAGAAVTRACGGVIR